MKREIKDSNYIDIYIDRYHEGKKGNFKESSKFNKYYTLSRSDNKTQSNHQDVE